jgi:hypothetical protein
MESDSEGWKLKGHRPYNNNNNNNNNNDDDDDDDDR